MVKIGNFCFAKVNIFASGYAIFYTYDVPAFRERIQYLFLAEIYFFYSIIMLRHPMFYSSVDDI